MSGAVQIRSKRTEDDVILTRGTLRNWREVLATWQVQESSFPSVSIPDGQSQVPLMLYTHALKQSIETAYSKHCGKSAEIRISVRKLTGECGSLLWDRGKQAPGRIGYACREL
jgi:hypothetical protein